MALLSPCFIIISAPVALLATIESAVCAYASFFPFPWRFRTALPNVHDQSECDTSAPILAALTQQPDSESSSAEGRGNFHVPAYSRRLL
jgi:hypothetical protein